MTHLLPASAVILAGGRSQRLGADKVLLRFRGEWLLQTIIAKLASLSDDVIVVADGSRELVVKGARIVADELIGEGVLGGLYSGLRAMRHARGLFVGCDMPFLVIPLLRYLVYAADDVDVAIPRIGDLHEPLHAVYHKNCIPRVAEALELGRHRPRSFFPYVRVRYVNGAEIDAYDPQHLSFFNINTSRDLRRALAIGEADYDETR